MDTFMDSKVPEGQASRERCEELALLVVDDSPDRVLLQRKRELFIDNLLVQIHLLIEMNSVDRPCAMEV